MVPLPKKLISCPEWIFYDLNLSHLLLRTLPNCQSSRNVLCHSCSVYGPQASFSKSLRSCHTFLVNAIMNKNNSSFRWQSFSSHAIGKGTQAPFKSQLVISLQLKHKTVKTNDKIRPFGVFMTPLSRKILKKIMQLATLKAVLARRINIRGCEDCKKIFKRL